QNLVNNPGFETGDMTSWTVTHLGSFSGVDQGGGAPNTGAHDFGMGATSATDQTDFFQDVPTTIGQQYNASFWAFDQDPSSAGGFQVTIGGVAIPAVLTNAYQQFSLAFTATATTTRLEATGWETNQWKVSDDYDVHLVPEPTSLLLLGL